MLRCGSLRFCSRKQHSKNFTELDSDKEYQYDKVTFRRLVKERLLKEGWKNVVR
jgi:hypothetical protein